MVPPVVDQMTRLVGAPITEAENRCWLPSSRAADAGVTATVTWSLMMSVAVADWVGSSTDVARTVTKPGSSGAVKRPVALMVPPVAENETAGSVAPVTVTMS
jgi:hypothetical protein